MKRFLLASICWSFLLGLTVAADRPAATKKAAATRPASVKDIAPPAKAGKSAGQDGQPAVTVKRIVETRVKQNKTSSMFAFESSELRITLHIEGGSADDADNVGNIKYEVASDDQKTDLRPESPLDADMMPARSQFGGMPSEEGNEKQKGLDVDLSLKVPARKATKLTHLKGSVQYETITQTAEVTIKKVSSHYGKTLSDAALKEAGLKVQVLDPKARDSGMFSFGSGDDPKRTVKLKMTGNLKAIKNVAVVNGDGEDIVEGSSWGGTDEERVSTYTLKEAVTASTVVTIELIAGSQRVTVPFDLKGIELP